MFGAIRVGFSGALSTVSTFVAEVNLYVQAYVVCIKDTSNQQSICIRELVVRILNEALTWISLGFCPKVALPSKELDSAEAPLQSIA